MTERQKRKAKYLSGADSGIDAVIEVDSDTFEIQNKFFINKKECQTVTLTSQQARNFASYALIKKDLKFVRKAFELAENIADKKNDVNEKGVDYRAEFDNDADILKSLFISGIITYGKCFTKADGRKVKLEVKDVFGKDNFEEKEIHLEVMELRHSYIAHGGITKYEKVNPILVLNPEDKNIPPILSTESIHLAGVSKGRLRKLLLERIISAPVFF